MVPCRFSVAKPRRPHWGHPLLLDLLAPGVGAGVAGAGPGMSLSSAETELALPRLVVSQLFW